MRLSPWMRERLAKMLETDDELLRGLRFFFEEAEKSQAPHLLRELEPFLEQTSSVPDPSQEPNWQPDAYELARAPLLRCAKEARSVVRRLLEEP